MQGTLIEHLGNTQRKSQRIFRENPENTQTTPREHAGNTQGILREHSEITPSRYAADNAPHRQYGWYRGGSQPL